MPINLCLIGAGGHGKVVFDVLNDPLYNQERCSIFYTDEDPEKTFALNMDVISQENALELATHFHVCIGDNKCRERLANLFELNKIKPWVICSPRSIVSQASIISAGAFIAPGSVIAHGANVGAYAIVNHLAVVDHGCSIGAYTHIAPGSIVCGDVNIGNRVLVGAGSVILPGLSIGSDAIIGAGSRVTENIESGMVWIGDGRGRHKNV